MGRVEKLNYMELLNQSIRVLEGGQLDYKVPVQGTDELAQMARSLNEMSASLKQQMEQVQQAQTQRYDLITSLSHDLRTPLTAQLGYLELLAEHRLPDPRAARRISEQVCPQLPQCHRAEQRTVPHCQRRIPSAGPQAGTVARAGYLSAGFF